MINFPPYKNKAGAQEFRLVHISDPHLSTLDHIRPGQLLNKRILGYLSWRLSRQRIHRRDILQKLISDLQRYDPHHLLISGDLTHIGTEYECRQVSHWLHALGNGPDISIVPGNHDRYINDNRGKTLGLWSDYMESDKPVDTDSRTGFPLFRKRGPVAIIGLSTAVATAPFFASGRLGAGQISRMQELLRHTQEQGLFRILMLHHGPLADSNKFRKRLVDAAEFRTAVCHSGAELIIHGHGHYPVYSGLDTDTGRIPVIGAASASVLSGSETKRAGYNVYTIGKTETGDWTLHSLSRRYENGENTFTTSRELKLELPVVS